MTQAELRDFHEEHFGGLTWNHDRKPFPQPVQEDDETDICLVKEAV